MAKLSLSLNSPSICDLVVRFLGHTSRLHIEWNDDADDDDDDERICFNVA